jgi:hypothetical protein
MRLRDRGKSGRARAITADVDLDRTLVTQRGNTVDVRWIMISQITEYARHNGHADIVRELIDGTTGE